MLFFSLHPLFSILLTNPLLNLFKKFISINTASPLINISFAVAQVRTLSSIALQLETSNWSSDYHRSWAPFWSDTSMVLLRSCALSETRGRILYSWTLLASQCCKARPWLSTGIICWEWWEQTSDSLHTSEFFDKFVVSTAPIVLQNVTSRLEFLIYMKPSLCTYSGVFLHCCIQFLKDNSMSDWKSVFIIQFDVPEASRGTL